MKFRKISLALIALMMLVMIGCGQEEMSTEMTYDGSLKIILPEQTVEIPYNDIYKMETTTATYKTITSSGEEITSEVTGVSLTTLLADQNTSLKDYSSVRGVAGDGYAIDVPGEILADKDILLIWSENGENYDAKKMPLRLAINDERAMYWVSNLKEIHCINEAVEVAGAGHVALSQIVFLEAASKAFDGVDITYYDTADTGIQVSDLFGTVVTSEQVKFVAVDNFEKTETLQILQQGLLKMTGDNAPLFMSPDLPKGMHVKLILQIETGNTVFVSEMNALEAYSKKSVDTSEGVSLIEIVDQAGLKADAYILTSTDGYSVEVSGKDLKSGILSKDEDIYKVKFDGLPKNTTVKDIYSISVASGAVSTEDQETSSTEMTLDPWSIEFTGLDDGSFVMDSDRAARKLDLVSLEATKTSKDGNSYDQVWQGYRLLDILEFLHVDDFNELYIVATDGYEITFTKDQVDEHMILGIIVDDQALTGNKGPVQLVTSSMTSNFWVKHIATIEVK